jgi:acetyl esterase/lipase
MHAMIFTGFRRTRPGGSLGLMILGCLLIAGCDASDPGTQSEPSDEDTSSVTSTTVTVQSDTLGLPGTLLMPDTSAAVPGVVIVHGSGPVDRNGQSPSTNHPPVYKRWAERMARHGIAVLRYDKRSTQPEVAQANPRDIAFLDFVRDAVAAGRLLQDREGTDPSRIVFVGHSQGGNVAPAAATRLENAAGVAALAAPAMAVDTLLVDQLETYGGGTGCRADQTRAQFDSLRTSKPDPSGLICGVGLTFWRQWIRHSQHIDSVAAALDPPILAQQGRADQNYPNETLERSLNGWRRIARAGDATVNTYDDVDHIFRHADSSATADAPLNDLIGWIRGRQ